MNALILCAGLGTRFLPITSTTPKPAIPFLNVPLLGYSLYYLEQLGVANIVINTHHLPDKVRTVARQLTQGRHYTVQFSHEPEILGSGGGIAQARVLLDNASVSAPFIVTNGDEVIIFAHEQGYRPLWDFHMREGALTTLLTTNHPEAGVSMGGVWVDGANASAHGYITQLGGTDPAHPGARHFTGVFVFSPRIFEYMPPAGQNFHIFRDCLHKAMAAGEKVLSYHDPNLMWLDMSSPKDHSHGTQAARVLLSRNSPCATTLRQILKRFNA